MLSRTRFSLLVLLFTLGALATRIPGLDNRVMHTDEAVQAYKTGELLQGQPFVYDALDFHGPVLIYSALLYLKALGIEHYPDLEPRHLRMIAVLYGSLLILWLLALYRIFSPAGLLFSAGLLLLTPALVYYSRYFIMETALVCFYVGFLVALLRFIARPTALWLYAGAICLGLMQATKETTVLLAGTAFLGMAATMLQHPDRGAWFRQFVARLNTAHYFGAALVAALVFVILITAGGSQPGNLAACLGGFAGYLHRGLDGSGHSQPVYYYLSRLLYFQVDGGPVWSDGLILILGGIGAVHFIRGTASDAGRAVMPGRFLAWNTLFGLLIFSLIPYKTPWNILSFQVMAILLAGQGMMVLFGRLHQRRQRIMLVLVLAGGLGHMAVQSVRANTQYAASPQNPYVYGHTSTDLDRLTGKLEQFAAFAPAGYALPVQVVAGGGDYWPLPFDLRRFTQVYWWQNFHHSVTPAPVIIATVTGGRDSIETAMAQFLYGGFGPGQRQLYAPVFSDLIQLRPGVHLLVFARLDLLQALESQAQQ